MRIRTRELSSSWFIRHETRPTLIHHDREYSRWSTRRYAALLSVVVSWSSSRLWLPSRDLRAWLNVKRKSLPKEREPLYPILFFSIYVGRNASARIARIAWMRRNRSHPVRHSGAEKKHSNLCFVPCASLLLASLWKQHRFSIPLNAIDRVRTLLSVYSWLWWYRYTIGETMSAVRFANHGFARVSAYRSELTATATEAHYSVPARVYPSARVEPSSPWKCSRATALSESF